MPQSVLFKGGSEGQMRKSILQSGGVDAVVGLPLNIFYGTGLPACIIVLRHPMREKRQQSNVLIIDASKLFEAGRAQNYLMDQHIRTIRSLYQDRKDVRHKSAVIDLSSIRDNSWTLNITRYVIPRVDDDVLPARDAVERLKRCLQRVRAAEDQLVDALSSRGAR